MYKLVSVLAVVLSVYFTNAQTYCFQSEDDVMTYVIGKTFESKDGQVSIKFNSSEAILKAGANNLTYMYDEFNYLGGGHKGLVTLTELGSSGGLRLYVSCKEKMMTDNKGTLLYEESSDRNGSLSGGSNASVTNNKAVSKATWMAENLNVNKFRNGDAILEAKTKEEWKKANENKQPAWCYYNNDPAKGEKYGKLYNWYAVNDSRGLAPKGCHVPSTDEYEINKDQFPHLSGGERMWIGSFIEGMGKYWLTTELDDTHAFSFSTDAFGHIYFGKYGEDMGCGFSVRCLKD